MSYFCHVSRSRGTKTKTHTNDLLIHLLEVTMYFGSVDR
jgi:hypothetical protein